MSFRNTHVFTVMQSRKICDERKLALSYRLPWSAMPRCGAGTGLQIALLHVRRLVQDVTVIVIEPLSVGPLTDHQACPPPSTTSLSTLMNTINNFNRNVLVGFSWWVQVTKILAPLITKLYFYFLV